jgi:hypothetical protein
MKITSLKIRFRFGIAAAVWAAGVSAAWAVLDRPARAPVEPVTADPTAWAAPPRLPTLSERLTGEKYRSRYDEALKNAPADEADGGPYCGQLVDEVLPASQGAQLGINADDVIVALRGLPVRGGHELNDIRDQLTGVQVMKVWSPAKKAYRMVEIAPGKIGVQTASLFRPDLAYLRSLPAGQKPDRDLLVASLSLATDYDLAETALFHATQAGADPGRTAVLAADVADSRGRFDEALAFTEAALRDLPDDQKWTAAMTGRAAAIAGFPAPVRRQAGRPVFFPGPGIEGRRVPRAGRRIRRLESDARRPDGQSGRRI